MFGIGLVCCTCEMADLLHAYDRVEDDFEPKYGVRSACMPQICPWKCRKDGDVYRSLLEVAQRSPFNDSEEGPAWKPVLEARLNPKARANAKL